MQNRVNHRISYILLVLVIIVHFSSCAQDTLSMISFYSKYDNYKKNIRKVYCDMNRHYKTGVKHGLFCIYDLSTPKNRLTKEEDTIFVVENHIYHVVSPSVYAKVSIIMIPTDRNLVFFEGLNCCKPIHTVEDAVFWLMNRFPNIDSVTLKNVVNYKEFHPDIPIDPQGSFSICETCCKEKSMRIKIKNKPPRILHVKTRSVN